MSRDIKFRAWVNSSVDSATGMHYPLVLQLLKDGSVDRLWTNDYKFTSDTCSFILMQYTGITDRHGKEIYEGDIVEFAPIAKVAVRAEVKWGHFGFTYKVPGDNANHYYQRDYVTVIGNIYENPELLEAKDAKE